jgi:hypothetical protein
MTAHRGRRGGFHAPVALKATEAPGYTVGQLWSMASEGGEQ